MIRHFTLGARQANLSAVKTSLDYLPEGKRRELAFVVEMVRAGFAEATARRTMPSTRNGKLLKVILYGSYARGDWVEDPVGRYFSDYDLLLVVSHDDLTDTAEYWHDVEGRLLAALSEGKRLRTPVSLIIHSLDDVNEKLRLGRYFFMDIVREGVVLFEEVGHSFVEPQPLTPQQALEETREYFEEWFESAGDYIRQYKHAVADRAPKVAVFDLHQATERLYHCLFLVRTLYSPKTHNLNRLRQGAEEMEPRIKSVWPKTTKAERRCFELLREAYVKARYSRNYRITTEQLAWLGERVELLKTMVGDFCRERLETLAVAA